MVPLSDLPLVLHLGKQLDLPLEPTMVMPLVLLLVLLLD